MFSRFLRRLFFASSLTSFRALLLEIAVQDNQVSSSQRICLPILCTVETCLVSGIRREDEASRSLVSYSATTTSWLGISLAQKHLCHLGRSIQQLRIKCRSIQLCPLEAFSSISCEFHVQNFSRHSPLFARVLLPQPPLHMAHTLTASAREQ